MSKTWFRFPRSSQATSDNPAHTDPDLTPDSDPAASPATSPATFAETADVTQEDMPEEIAVMTSEETPGEIPIITAATHQAPPPDTIPSNPSPTERLAVALGAGEATPSYVDTQSAGDWLAMLSQISAVTAYKTLSYDLLDLRPRECVVDVGCGLGQDARALAQRIGPDGSVVGVDSSEEMIARAIAATDEATSRQVRFLAGDATALPLETGAYDALRADRLLQHVDDPLQALIEFRRVLRPGARIVLIEPDWKTMAVYPGSAAGGDDDRCVAAIFDWQVAHTRHPLIGRQLRMLLTQAGFTSVSVAPVAYASTRFIEADLTLELSHAAAGAVEQWPTRLRDADVAAWRVTAQAADAAGHFFASVPLFFAHATVA